MKKRKKNNFKSGEYLNNDGFNKDIKWKRGPLLGKGGFAEVYMSLNLDTGELIAVKQVPVPQQGAESESLKRVSQLEKEIHLLQDLEHPNIVRYLGFERNDQFINIFLEYVSGGSISSLLLKFGCFNEKLIQIYCRQILLGLEYLHSKEIAHRDIKGANILLDHNAQVKLSDFGASKKLEDLVPSSNGTRSFAGTPYWMAPEVVQRGYDQEDPSIYYKADVWSLGAVIIEMATGLPPWGDLPVFTALYKIGSTPYLPTFPTSLSFDSHQFLGLCFQRDVSQRATVNELLKLPFVNNIEE